MSAETKKLDFDEVLDGLEQQLETPVVPGELESWTGEAQLAMARLAHALRHRVEDVHDEQLAEIAAEDAELVIRVEALRGEDEALLEEVDRLRSRAAKLNEAAPRAEPNERRLGRGVDAFVEEALAFVIRVRKQEVALRTWYQEAFQRDRGVAD